MRDNFKMDLQEIVWESVDCIVWHGLYCVARNVLCGVDCIIWLRLETSGRLL